MGIAAIINTDLAPLEAALLQGMMRFASCRGSSSARIGRVGPVGLASCPLAISDAPGTLAGLDGDVWAVMDGRLDDRAALIAALDGLAASAPAEVSDEELIVRAYGAWGDECVAHLLGDFAFCLWDARRQRLFCARDHFGVKPLYYARLGNVLVVSTVLRCIRSHPAISGELCARAVGDFLLFGVSAEPSQTSFRDISRVPPAHQLAYSLVTDTLRVERYWSVPAGDVIRYAQPREYVEQFSALLRVAVGDRLRAGPVAVLMSGGLDSSSVATMAADILGPSGKDQLRAFTFVYDTWPEDEEKRYASFLATALGIQASLMPVDEYYPFDRWDGDSRPPEPSLEGLTAVMIDMLDLTAGHGGNALLTGDGGDPMLLPSSVLDQLGTIPLASLAGDVWQAWRLRRLPPFGVRSSIARWFGHGDTIPDWLAGDLLAEFDAKARMQEVRRERSVRHGARNRAISDVIDPWWTSAFESLDPGATGRGVELRYPFFDVRLASFALRLPSFPWCLGKHVLRAAMNGKLPELLRTRPKTPLAASPVMPGRQWSSARALTLLESTAQAGRFIDIDKFRATVCGNSLLASETPSAWAAISLAMWLKCEAAGMRPAATM
jgi:asparagine synthase (glutamine-hydrolysing)